MKITANRPITFRHKTELSKVYIIDILSDVQVTLQGYKTSLQIHLEQLYYKLKLNSLVREIFIMILKIIISNKGREDKKIIVNLSHSFPSQRVQKSI